MKLKLWNFVMVLTLAAASHAATNDLTALLQKGLFEEEANRDLAAAISDYQSLASAFDKDRQLAATAIFRLGECYRKLGKTNEAVLQYERIVKEFREEQTLATLSRQNMEGLGRSAQPLVEQRNATDAGRAKELELVKRLKSMPLDEIRQVAPTVLTDATLINLIYQFNQGELNMARLLTDHGAEHPEIKKEQSMQDTLSKKIQERLDGLILALSLERDVSGMAQKESAAANASNAAITAMEENEIRNIQAMIQNSPDLINAPGSNHYTPLGNAAAQGQLVVARYLLDHGADVNRKTSGPPSTPLYAAAQNGHKTMVELLLARGADVDAGGLNPLYQAVSHGFIGVAEVLLAHKADVNLVGINGQRTLNAAAYAGRTNLVQSLINNGADINVKDDRGNTPLNSAASMDELVAAKLLIAAKASEELRNNDGNTPLHEAAKSGHTEMVSLLVNLGAEVDATNNDKATPLFLAVQNGWVDISRILLEHKADPNHRGIVQESPNIRYDSQPVSVAIRKRHADILKLLLDAGADPEGDPASSSRPLFSALGWDKRAVALLLDKGADPNATTSEGMSPLFLTTDPEIGRLLVEHKADVNLRRLWGGTPLMHASDTNFIKFLLAAGAQVDLQETNGNTALHSAVYNARPELVAILLDHQANPNIQNNKGYTPLDIAKDGLDGQISRSKVYMVDGTAAVSSASEQKISELLIHAGGLADLPKRDRIEVRRAANSAFTISKDTDGRNRYSVLEVIASAYGIISQRIDQAGQPPFFYMPLMGSGSPVKNLSFPDFKKVVIYRRTENSAKQTAINVNVEDILNTGDCSRDVWVEWGDVVEIPEADHPVDQQGGGLIEKNRQALIQCTARHVTIKIKGVSATYPPEPAAPVAGAVRIGVSETPSFMLRSVLNNSGLIRVSSDLSRVKVTRVDPTTKKNVEWTIDGTDPKQSDLWLRDGDMIEVPEK